MKITFPEMAEGQIGWTLYRDIPISISVSDNRRWYRRAIYISLIWLHDRYEAVWHWAYRTSRNFAPPATKNATDYVEIGTYACTIKDGIVTVPPITLP